MNEVVPEPMQKAAIEMNGMDVALTITCTDHYAAMLLYDKLSRELEAGYVELKITGSVRAKE